MSTQPNEKRLGYEPPRAVRLANRPSGAGDCDTGSGDENCDAAGNSAGGCYSGSDASTGCDAGNSAGTGCYGDGNSAIDTCAGAGSGFEF